MLGGMPTRDLEQLLRDIQRALADFQRQRNEHLRLIQESHTVLDRITDALEDSKGQGARPPRRRKKKR